MRYQQPLGADVDAPYIDGNPQSGTPGSPVPAAAIEHTQREIVNLIMAGGLQPDSSLNQAALAVRAIVEKMFDEHNDIINPHNITPEQIGAATADELNQLNELLTADAIKIFLSDNATAGVDVSVLSIIPVDADDDVGIILLAGDGGDFYLDTPDVIHQAPSVSTKDYVLNISRSQLIPETTYRVRAYIRNKSGAFSNNIRYSSIMLFTSSGSRAWNIDVYSRGATNATTAKAWALSMINSRPGDTLTVQWRQNYTYGTGNGSAVGSRRITNGYTL